MPAKSKKKVKRLVKKPQMTTAKVAKIAKASVKEMAEKKYFKTQSITTTPEPSARVHRNYISAIGFSTTDNMNPYSVVGSSGAPIDYEFPANTNVYALDMLSPYLSTETDENLVGFVPDGKFVQPVSAKCRWNIQRDYSEILSSPESSTTPTVNKQILRNLWVDIRCIQVTPKTAPGTSGSTLDPRFDLLVDNYGIPTSIDADNVTPNPDNNDLFNYKVNKRRYEVIADKKYVLGNPLTLQYQRSHAEDYVPRYDPQVANVNKQCELNITTYHQLSQRKNGKVYYDEADQAQPTNGHRREYVFFLFKYRAGDSLINNIGGEDNEISPCEIIVKAIPQSKFIDV